MPLVAQHDPRPSHPRPTFVTTRPSLLPGRDGGKIHTISDKAKDKYFCNRGWTSPLISEMAKADLPDKSGQVFSNA
jgi:hypothetical protein